MSEYRSLLKSGAHTAWQKTLRISKRIALLLMFLGALSGLAYYGFGNMTYSSGSRSGQIIKLSHKGIVFKTYEGELFLGVYTPAQPSFAPGNVWAFSVLKKEVYQQIQSLEGKQVKLFYHEHYRTFPWQGETRYFIYKAEAITN